jgi:DMSO reductase anchor subunit
MLPADFFRVRSGHHHVPLVVMLVLTQLAVGTFCFGVLLAELGLIQWLGPEQGHAGLLAACAGVLALAASTLHLGRPLYAFRAVLGFRRSWLSREILAFGAFAALSLFHAAVLSPFPESWRKAGAAGAAQLASGTGKIGVVVGLLAVFCSVMVYHATRRELWSVARSAARFFGSTLILGISTTLAVSLLTAKVSGAESIHAVWRWLAQALGAIVIAKLCWEASVLFHVKHKRFSELKRSALLLSGELRRLFSGRLAFGFSGAILLGALTASDSMTGGIVALALASWAALLVGELLERLLFFRAASGPSMPGGYQ